VAPGRTGDPPTTADSTFNLKRRPVSLRWGMSVTMPVTVTSRPSSAGSRDWAANCEARRPVRPKASAARARRMMSTLARAWPVRIQSSKPIAAAVVAA
jgi:hypothetical protein